MTASTVTKILCSNNGALDYNELVANIGSCGIFGSNSHLEQSLRDRQKFAVVQINGGNKIIAKTSVRLCKAKECENCNNLHLCKFYLFGECQYNRGRRRCRFCHDLTTQHNAQVLRDHDLQDLDRKELCLLLLQNDQTLLPPVCYSFNKGSGQYGSCPDQANCTRLHICEQYIRGHCRQGVSCSRSHSFHDPAMLRILTDRGLTEQLISTLPSVYLNILNMKNSSSTASDQDKTEICIYFVRKDCKHGARCFKAHFDMPYKWEVWAGLSWSALPNNEKIEKEFCDPANTCSSSYPPVDFLTMTQGAAKVRRLSTVSSVTRPDFILTTAWTWYWQDEFSQWMEYAASSDVHHASSITSEDLEKKYMEDSSSVLQFTAGHQEYVISFKDMIQINKRYKTVKHVRRRPVFVSRSDAEAIKKRKSGPNRSFTPNFKAVPTYWDKSQLPETGYKRIEVLESTEEHNKVKNLFRKTMFGFTIKKIERIQNKSLWEIFQWQAEQMKKHNRGRNVNEKLLFHGTDSAYVDAICKQNFDWRICGTHGTAYGKGSYFARDAKYSHSYTGSSSSSRTMFVTRVLVGESIKGNSGYLRPPSKDGGDTNFYDSCVDDTLNPSIYVVFEKQQVYPEYVIQYQEDSPLQAPTPSYVMQPTPAPQPKPVYTYVNTPRVSVPPATTSFTSKPTTYRYSQPPPPPPKPKDSCTIS
ncbi:protein mono-ADP-ribosyltransferase PARP12-like [Acipenser ruthenus]|uniref:protein mono-ADP-ribosyltransferase PARP12-like n=1 Tax=Acipenser ruthenus TaxID=7906 RepID=UPI002740BB79|nr:protein mono-ADP-ribosyltransferase PARP12-like [Acipenser ruthenus]